jgi:hypothetical protein
MADGIVENASWRTQDADLTTVARYARRMSPVSRGRKSKKAKKGKKPPARATSSGWAKAARSESASAGFSRPLDRYTQWWEPSHERVIAASGGLLAARGPRGLEQATAELVGAELYDAVREERYGFRFDLWAVELVDRTAKRIVDAASRGDDSWPGPWWLLHGLASIGSYGLGSYAWEQASKAAGSLPRDAGAADPEWLKLLPGIKATGDVRVMRDAYGTRFGVMAAVSYPSGVDPSVYLIDIDASELIGLAGAGVFDDMDEAAAAWREQVGVSAEGLTPVPATPESLTCLVYCEHEDQQVSGDESRMLMDNWFRGPRRMHDVHNALQERGIALPEYHSLFHDIDVAPMAGPFIEWYSERHGHRPSREAVEALAWEWLEGMLPGTEHSVSPKRSEAFRGLISDWLDDPITDAVLALLPEWVRWNGEQAGVPGPLIERAVSAASAG